MGGEYQALAKIPKGELSDEKGKFLVLARGGFPIQRGRYEGCGKETGRDEGGNSEGIQSGRIGYLS